MGSQTATELEKGRLRWEREGPSPAPTTICPLNPVAPGGAAAARGSEGSRCGSSSKQARSLCPTLGTSATARDMHVRSWDTGFVPESITE